jgi:hypothetical protein
VPDVQFAGWLLIRNAAWGGLRTTIGRRPWDSKPYPDLPRLRATDARARQPVPMLLSRADAMLPSADWT